MSAFEFFFSFYGLLLGFSAAELVGGFARLVHHRRHIQIGVLSLLLGVFVAVDIATFWNQAWIIFRNAPFNLALLVLGLFVAGVFYVAASLTFPRELTPGQSINDHFWAHRRLVLLCVLGANWIMVATLFIVTGLSGELATLHLPPVFWIGLALFSTFSLVAAFASGRRIVLGALVILCGYHAFTIGRTALTLVDEGGWSITGAAAPSNEIVE
jgi:hypothetical protein